MDRPMRDDATYDADARCLRCGLGWDDEKDSSDNHVCPPGFWSDYEKRIVALEAEVNTWKNTAEQSCSNEEFYRDLLDETGKHLGPQVFIANDGSKMDSPLRLKIPGLVAALEAQLAEARDKLQEENARIAALLVSLDAHDELIKEKNVQLTERQKRIVEFEAWHRDYVDSIKAALAPEAAVNKTEDLERELNAMTADRDMWLGDDTKQNSAVGRLIRERDDLRAHIVALSAVQSAEVADLRAQLAEETAARDADEERANLASAECGHAQQQVMDLQRQLVEAKEEIRALRDLRARHERS